MVIKKILQFWHKGCSPPFEERQENFKNKKATQKGGSLYEFEN